MRHRATSIAAPNKPLTAQGMMDALRKTAQILTHSFGVEVIFRGNQAATDGKRIIVPSLPDDAPPDLVEAIIGFVDHEAGHIMFTDMAFWNGTVGKYKDKRVIAMTNAIEDPRQEYRLGAEYRGAGLNLERSMIWALERLTTDFNRRDKWFQFSTLVLLRNKQFQGDPTATAFYAKHRGKLGELVERFDEDIKTLHLLPDVQASFALAKKIVDEMDKLKEEMKEENEASGSGSGKSKSGKGGQSKGEPKSGKGSGNKPDNCAGEENSKESGQGAGEGNGDEQKEGSSGSGKSEPKPQEPQGEKDGEKSSGKDDDGAEGDEQGSGDDGAGDDEDGDEDAGSGGDAEADDGNSADDDAGAEGEGAGGDLEEPFKEKPTRSNGKQEKLSGGAAENLNVMAGNDHDPKEVSGKTLHEYTSEKISKLSSDVSGYRVFSTEFDREVEPFGKESTESYAAAADEVRPYVNVVSGVMTRTLIAETRARVLHGRYDGKLSMNGLARLRTGQPNVFKKKKKGRDLDTYVELVVDHSGSMDGPKSKLAAQTCLVLAEALDKVGVPFGICGFTCGWMDNDLDRARKERLSTLSDEACSSSGWHRIEPIIEYVYKRGNEPYQMVKAKLPLMTRQVTLNNCDGDSILRVVKRVLATRKEKRKLVIVMSDGNPVAGATCGFDPHHAWMKSVSERIKRTKGIEMVGIGIYSDAVRSFYDRNVVVNDLTMLPEIAMTELKRALMGDR